MSDDEDIINTVPFTGAEIEIYSIDYDDVFTYTAKKKEAIVRQIKMPVHSTSFTVDELRVQPWRWSSREVSYPLDEVEQRWYWEIKPSLPNRSEQRFGFHHGYLPTSRLHFCDSSTQYYEPGSMSNLATEEALDRYFANSVTQLWSLYNKTILQAVNDAQEKGLASILKAVLSPSAKDYEDAHEIDIERAYISVRNFLKRQSRQGLLGSQQKFSGRYNKDESFRRIVYDIYQIEKDINEAMASRRLLQSLITKLYGKHLDIEFKEDDIIVKTSNGKNIGLNSLSSGQKHLIIVFLGALMAGSSAIFIDEPEISMHIDWQVDLVAYMNLLNPNAQYVLATHSPEIMSNVPDENIIEL